MSVLDQAGMAYWMQERSIPWPNISLAFRPAVLAILLKTKSLFLKQGLLKYKVVDIGILILVEYYLPSVGMLRMHFKRENENDTSKILGSAP